MEPRHVSMPGAGLILCLLTGTAHAQDRASMPSKVLAILAEAEGASQESADALSRRIAFLGSEALPAVLDILELGHGGGQDPRETVGRLSPMQTEILYDSLVLSGRDAVVPLLEPRSEEDIAARVVLRVLADLGLGEDIRIGLEVSDSSSTEELEQTVTRILQRDLGAFAALKNHIRSETPDNASTLVRAAGATASYAGMQTLVELLGPDPGLDRVLLTHIGQIGRAAPWHVNDHARESVRRYLSSEDEQVRRSALYAAGGLGDYAVVETAIGLLESESRSSREAAHWALKNITGLGFSANPAAWVSWHATESRWYEERARRLFGQLATSSSRGIANALGELSAHCYRRDVSVEKIVVLLNHGDPFVRRAACQALRDLQAAAAVPALVASMADTDEGVALQAWNALKTITGRQTAFDVDAWSRELQVQL